MSPHSYPASPTLPPATVLVIFGAGVDRKPMNSDEFFQRLRQGVNQFSRQGLTQEATRGQYGPGQIEGQTVPGYRQEPNVAPQSQTETYAAIKFFIDNWRWQDVPFYLRSGKRLPNRDLEIVIQFRPVLPHPAFPASALAEGRSNHLVIHIQLDEGIVLHFQAKRPGPTLSFESRGHALHLSGSVSAHSAGSV